jgi:hypothetical protein
MSMNIKLTPEQEQELDDALEAARADCSDTDFYDISEYFFYKGVSKTLQLTQEFKPVKLPVLFKPKSSK